MHTFPFAHVALEQSPPRGVGPAIMQLELLAPVGTQASVIEHMSISGLHIVPPPLQTPSELPTVA